MSQTTRPANAPRGTSTTFTVHRGETPADRFLMLTNDFARGKLPVPLRALARVLLIHLISLPPGWKGARQQLDEAVLEGRDAVKGALAELERAGYLLRTKRRSASGAWSWEYAVTIDPIAHPLAQPSPEKPSMAATSGNGEDPQVAPSPGNPALVNQAITTEDGTQKTEEVPARASRRPVRPTGSSVRRTPGDKVAEALHEIWLCSDGVEAAATLLRDLSGDLYTGAMTERKFRAWLDDWRKSITRNIERRAAESRARAKGAKDEGSRAA